MGEIGHWQHRQGTMKSCVIHCSGFIGAVTFVPSIWISVSFQILWVFREYTYQKPETMPLHVNNFDVPPALDVNGIVSYYYQSWKNTRIVFDFVIENVMLGLILGIFEYYLDWGFKKVKNIEAKRLQHKGNNIN